MTTTQHESNTAVRPWVRIGLVALAAPNLGAGIWAVLAPQSWFDTFPGWAPHLVAAEPPYNAHLATDAGAGLLASGVVLLLAAWFADRRSIQLSLVAFAAFSIPHAAYHVLHKAPGLTSVENVQSASLLVFTAVAAVALFLASNARPARVSGSVAP